MPSYVLAMQYHLVLATCKYSVHYVGDAANLLI